jgi:hypothetical protein
MDVNSFFLNGGLSKAAFVKQSLGFVVEGQEHKVMRLHKALYGCDRLHGPGT